MSVVSVRAKDFILALFIRDDGERFLLGDNGYDFKDSQLHFSANTIENDEVQKQGADGVMLAGQVRRSSVQSFDGYVGDATTLKETIEEMRRDFIAFFAKGHHFRVIYIDTARNAWQRKGGYLVDAPEVKELYQIHPDYHVGLNFEDVNYYSYDEDKDGNEILSNLIDVPVSTDAEGGLVWDEDGAVSEEATVEYDTETATATPAKSVHISDAAEAPLVSFQLDGETSQNGTPTPSAPVAVNTTTGENVVKICGKNLFNKSISYNNTTIDAANGNIGSNSNFLTIWAKCQPNTTYTISKGAPTTRFVVADSTKIPQAGDHCNVLDGTNTQATSKTITTSSSAKYLIAMVKSGQDTLSQQAILDFMQIELGSPATAYEPYQDRSYEVNLGKNLFDKNTAAILNGQINSDKTYSTTAGKTIFIRCQPNTSYAVQKLNSDRSRVGTSTAYIPDGGTLTNYSVDATLIDGKRYVYITSGANDSYLWLTYATGNESSSVQQQILDSIQIEKGSTATTYAAYFEPIELCKIGDYQDYIYKSDDKWYVRKECGNSTRDVAIAAIASDNTSGADKVSAEGAFLMFSGDWGSDYATTAGVARLSANVGTYKLDANITGNTGARAMESGTFCQRQGTNDRVYFRNTSLVGKTGNEVKSLLATSGGTNLWYPLATPTDTEITNQALIAQLEAVLGGRTYAGINNIFTITPNEQGSLEISYYTKYQPVVSEGGYIWEAGGAGGATTVINNSIGNVNPVWTIYGPTNNPVLENTTTGEQIEYVGLIAEGQTLTIDMSEQTASLDGLNVISNVIGDYISLAPGANTLIYSVSGDAGASELGWSEIVG